MSEFPLQTLLELSQQRLDDAARQLGTLLASEHEGEQKLELLQRYRDEYHARFLQAAQRGMGPDEWRNYQTFLGKLDDAIGQQKGMVALAKQKSAAGQQSFMDERTRVKAFDMLSQRHDAREQKAEAKREQRESDEYSAKKFHAEKP